MTKLKLFLSFKSKHYKNRIKKRKGNTLYFLFSKIIGKKPSYINSKTECLIWKYKNHVFLSQDGRLQTYINKKYKF